MPTKRISKTMQEKQDVIMWIEHEGGGVPTRAVTHFRNMKGWKISGAQVRYWWKKRDEIKNAAQTQEGLKGAVPKPRLGELEDVLFDQILYLRSNKEKVSRQWIQETAKTMATSEIGYSHFAASDRWLAGFMERYGLSLRRATNLTILSDDEVTTRADKYMQFLQSKRNMIDLERCQLMDETAVYFDDPRRETVEATGARHVVLKSSGFASMRITAILAVTASAKKITPLLIWKGKSNEIF
jgi:hypothetical protein